MLSMRRLSLALMLLTVFILSLIPVGAQEEELPVLILPVNRAQFLPGARFDFSVEVHSETMPENFAVSINGEDAATFFGAEAEMTSWTFGSEEAPIPAQAAFWRNLQAPAAGEYLVEVTAGGTVKTATWTVREPQNNGAQNIILFIADGGTVATYTAARLISRGMEDGSYLGELSFEAFEEIGLLHTSGLDSIITDSANSASAYNTGHKSAVNATGVYPNTSPDPYDDPYQETFAEMVSRTRGMAVGIVTTAEFTDATPAAVWSHSRQRTSTTASDYAIQPIGLGASGAREWGALLPDVIFGGAGRYMIPQSVEGSGRGDDIDAFAAYEEAGYTLVTNATEVAALSGEESHVLGVFHPSNMSTWLDRNVYTDNLGDFADQPGLVEMTTTALGLLADNENGFYLEVEAASIDKALHPMDFERAIADTIEFDRTIAATQEWLAANGLAENTLIVVTSDHGHSFDVYGTVNTTEFNAATDDLGRRDAIGIYADAGFPTYEDADGDFFPDSWETEITLAWGKADNPEFTEDFQVSPVYRTPSIRNEAEVYVDNPEDDPNGIFRNSNLPTNSSSSVHTMQDVPVYATGPGAEYFGQSMDNTEVFFGMAAAIGLDPSAEDGMTAQVNASPAYTAPANGFNVTSILLVIVGIGAGMFLSLGFRRNAR